MSEFLNHRHISSIENSSEIDFDTAVKLPEGGSTCDIYRTRWQRREVFVKRLKKQYRSKPLYLDALDKEFEIGVNLNHPGLPRYLEFHRDYIVMEYIDGMTLADMIGRKDSWLANKKHITQLLKALVDVVDYLHRHNVVHCDIKPDNIMITANGKNLVLIDFDKCYTDALNDTSGHPSKFGLTLDQSGRMELDFRGIGLVAERLNDAGFGFGRYRQFVKACHKPDADCEELLEILTASEKTNNDSDDNGISDRRALIIAGWVLGICMLVAIIGTVVERSDKPKEQQEIENVKESVKDQPQEAVSITDEIALPVVESTPTEQTTVHESVDNEPEPFTQERILSEVQNRIRILDDSIQPYFDQLQAGIDRLEELRNDTTATRQQLLRLWNEYREAEDEIFDKVTSIVIKLYPDYEASEIGKLISSTTYYKDYIRRAKSVKPEYNKEIDSRSKE